MNIVSDLQESHSVTVLCEAFDIHTSTFNYHRSVAKRINPETVRINAMVTSAHSLSNGSAGARTIAHMVTQQGTPLSRYRAAGFMRRLELVSSQPPAHSYKKAFQPHSTIPNTLNREFDVDAPDQVWCGDVTYIWTGRCWSYLAVVLDLFARKPVGWEVHDCELGDFAASLVHKAVMKELVVKDQLVLHADNCSIQKGSTLRAKLEFLGVSSSFSRPRVSNDNPYSESLFRTCKYCPAYPEDGFESLVVAREWMSTFVNWYNNEHRHSGAKHVTPTQRHDGTDQALLDSRHALYEQAKSMHPNPWSGSTRNWQRVEKVWLNPENKIHKPTRAEKMAA